MNGNNNQMEINAVFKIIVLGQHNVGKTLLIRRYVDGTYDSD